MPNGTDENSCFYTDFVMLRLVLVRILSPKISYYKITVILLKHQKRNTYILVYVEQNIAILIDVNRNVNM